MLLGDGDSDPVMTQCAMYRGQVRFSAPGRTVYVAWAPPGMDFADLVCERDGIERIVAILQAAQPMARRSFLRGGVSARQAREAGARIRQWRCSPGGAGRRREGRTRRGCALRGGRPKGRPVIKIVGGELDRCVNEAESALIGSDPEFYVYAGQLVRPVVHEAPGADMVPTSVHGLTDLTKPYLIEAFTTAADWLQFDGRAKAWVRVDCPKGYAEVYLARGAVGGCRRSSESSTLR